MVKEIQKLVEERSKLLDINYNDPKADDLQKDIEVLVIADFENLDCDFIIETYTKLGRCPSVLYDDNGFFCVCENGTQDIPVSFDEGVEEKLVQNMSFFIENKKWWHPTIREAIKFWLTNEE